MVPQNLIRPNVVMQCKKGYDSRIDIFMYKCQINYNDGVLFHS